MAKKKNQKVKSVDYSTANRKIARSIALKRLKDAGMIKLCKKTGDTQSPNQMRLFKGHQLPNKKRSYFANHWREVVYG